MDTFSCRKLISRNRRTTTTGGDFFLVRFHEMNGQKHGKQTANKPVLVGWRICIRADRSAIAQASVWFELAFMRYSSSAKGRVTWSARGLFANVDVLPNAHSLLTVLGVDLRLRRLVTRACID